MLASSSEAASSGYARTLALRLFRGPMGPAEGFVYCSAKLNKTKKQPSVEHRPKGSVRRVAVARVLSYAEQALGHSLHGPRLSH
jgi:hypothetical protein